MASTQVSVPIQVCQPRCFVIEPKINRFDAIARAGARADKAFGGLAPFLKRGEVSVKPIQRRLAPFWHVRCKSRFHYDRARTYPVSVDSDVVEVTLEREGEGRLVFPVDPHARTREVMIQGIERCVTERDVSEIIDTYDLPEPESLTQKAKSLFREGSDYARDQARLKEYVSSPAQQVNDVAAFFQSAMLDGQPIYTDLIDESVQIVLPDKPANSVVEDVMKKVMVSIDPITIHDWSLTVEVADLYFRPLYVFEFTKTDRAKNVLETKLEQLDALNGAWSTISSQAIKPSNIPWNKILLLTRDASAVVLMELSGPWLKVAAGLLDVGAKHVPGIIEEMKRSE